MYFQIVAEPDWSSDRAIAFDLDFYDDHVRVFFPKSQTREHEGATFVSDWILGKKIEELGERGITRHEVEVELATIVDRDSVLPEARDRAKPAPSLIDASNVVALFDRAAESIRFPKLHLRTPSGQDVTLKRSGANSKAPGTIYVDNGARWGEVDRTYFGAIHRDGRFVPAHGCPSEVVTLVIGLDKDPEAELVQYGRATGNCSCCGRLLTDETSVQLGIGPVCRSRFF